MPITQDRMLALLDAATEYEYALETLCARIEEGYRRTQSKRSKPDEVLLEIWTYAQPTTLVRRIIAHAKNMAAERQHFGGTTRARNRRAAEKMKRKREQGGTATGTVTSTTRPVRNPDSPPPRFRRGTTAPPPASDLVRLQEEEIYRMAEIAAKVDAEEGNAMTPDGALDFGTDGTDLLPEGFKGNGDGLTAEQKAELDREMDALERLGLMDTSPDGEEGEGEAKPGEKPEK